MIETLVMHEFKAFREAQIRFGRLTVLVEPNASGKTSVLEALH